MAAKGDRKRKISANMNPDLFENVVLQDEAYIERLKKHYLMFRSGVRKRKSSRALPQIGYSRAIQGTEKRLSLPDAEKGRSHNKQST